jgi:hypothetical protein
MFRGQGTSARRSGTDRARLGRAFSTRKSVLGKVPFHKLNLINAQATQAVESNAIGIS